MDKPTLAAQRGITMVESLVALVVLSIGLLGIAGMYVMSLQTGRTAMLRTQAVNLVSDLGDRIRANGSAGIAYDLAAYGGAPAEHACVVVANCSAAELAEDDLARWLDSVDDTLPTGVNAQVVFTPAAATGLPDQYRIDLDWREASEDFSYGSSTFLIAAAP
ncbi:MAG: type IV pilus modification protein PilV [Steroidobacteraceae bacterium]